MKRFFIFILLVLAFLSAAKSHGRQHRLERELEGHWKVSFTSENHPWVERFWFRHRVLYWSIASVTAIIMIALLKQSLFGNYGKWQWILSGLFTIGGSMIVAFVVTGLVSWARLVAKLSRNPAAASSEWLDNLHLINLGWWLLTASLATLLFKVFKSEISNLKS
jgi:hypothetical protein